MIDIKPFLEAVWVAILKLVGKPIDLANAGLEWLARWINAERHRNSNRD
jgi:hypothetical protein